MSYEDPLTATPLTGSAEIDAHAALLRSAFPDAALEPTAPMLEGGDHACIPWKLTGTHEGEVGPLPPTEKPLALHGLHYVELRTGGSAARAASSTSTRGRSSSASSPSAVGWGRLPC